MSNKTKVSIIFVIGALILLPLLAYLTYTSETRSDKIAVQVSVLPEDAEVVVNDIDTRNSRTVYLDPGEYIVSATRDGFSSYTETHRINEQENVIDFILLPESQEADDYISQNEDLYLAFEDRSGERAVQDGIRFSDTNPITRDLPYSTFFFTIGYRLDPSDPSEESIIVEIDAGEGYKNTALQHLRNLGYNPTEYNINFRNHRNPFNE